MSGDLARSPGLRHHRWRPPGDSLPLRRASHTASGQRCGRITRRVPIRGRCRRLVRGIHRARSRNHPGTCRHPMGLARVRREGLRRPPPGLRFQPVGMVSCPMPDPAQIVLRRASSAKATRGPFRLAACCTSPLPTGLARGRSIDCSAEFRAEGDLPRNRRQRISRSAFGGWMRQPRNSKGCTCPRPFAAEALDGPLSQPSNTRRGYWGS